MTDEQIAKLADVLTHRVWEYIWDGDDYFPAMPHKLTHNTYNLLRCMPELVAEYQWEGDRTEMPEGMTRNMYDKARASVVLLNELSERLDAIEGKLDALMDEV